MQIIKQHTLKYPNEDREIVEVIKLDDTRYKDGVIYTFRYLRYVEESGAYETLFAVENSHGQPHMHIGERKYEVDYDWKQAFAKFDELRREYEGKIGLNK